MLATMLAAKLAWGSAGVEDDGVKAEGHEMLCVTHDKETTQND